MRLYLDLLPGHDPVDRAEAEARGAVTDRGPGWVEVGDPAAIAEAPPGAGLWLVGLEAAGDVGSTSALVLMRAAASSGRRWVCAGLGLQASAAALAIGAHGVSIDVAAWVTRGSPLSDEVREALLRARSGRGTEIRDGRRVLRGTDLAAPQSVLEARRGADRTAAQLVDHVRTELEARLAEIREHHALDTDPLGTGRPLVQGPMANVSEGTTLARAIARAGAYPFAALGALRPEQARRVLQDFARDLDGPWGAGIIGFEMMPHRDAHLELARECGAHAILLAGGSPALAVRIQESGTDAWLHTPSATLARQAIDRGVRTVIFEGHEAGGHVGTATSVGLWEEGLEVAAERARGTRVVLAGGIGDEVSAAFAAAMGARAIARGCQVVLQAGTAWMFSHEVVEGGQLTAIAQQQALACSRTELVGSTVNLPLRCAPNPYTRAARELEARWLDEGLPLSERRARMEHHNLGRTRLGAKGIERNPDWPDQGARYRTVSPRRQIVESAFSLGQGAILTDRLETVSQIAARLTDGARALLHIPERSTRFPAAVEVVGTPSTQRARDRHGVQLGATAQTTDAHAPIAIVGVGCVVPGASDVRGFWRNLVEGVDAVGPMPPERWSPHHYWDRKAGSTGPVKTYARHAGVVDFTFDPLAFKIPPRIAPTLDRSQQLALVASAQAVRDAGWDRSGFDRRRAAVIFGNSMGGEHAKGLALRVRFREVLAALEAEGALDALDEGGRDALFARVEERLSPTLPPVAVDSMAGLLANVVAGRVASWLDWMGGNLTVDAACAASLAAIAVAVDWLRSGRCDAVLTGGIDTDMAPSTFVGFSRTQALSPTGSSPFSSQADGFVMGEGAAVFALRRLDDALAAGEPVWAVIRGVGQSSDGRGRGITAPRAEGQRLALRRAWEQAGIGPEDIELVEAHGTGTALGDATEVGVLTELLGAGEGRAWLGSVKSMIGHLKAGAGSAGLLKTALSVATGVAAPTLHAGPVSPTLGLEGSRIALPRGPVRLRGGLGTVSAFGFGGTNFHLVVERAPEEAVHSGVAELRTLAEPMIREPDEATWREDDGSPLLIAFGAPDALALLEAVSADRPASFRDCAGAEHRCVVVCRPADRARTLAKVARWLESGPATPTLGAVAFHGTGPAEPVTLLVPGQGSQHPDAEAGPRSFPAGARVLHALGVDADRTASDPVTLHRRLVPIAAAWSAIVERAGLDIAATLGHSLGEIGALVAAGRLTAHGALTLAEIRGTSLQACEPGAMLAVDLPRDEAESLAEAHGLDVAVENAPRSHVVAGSAEAVRAAAAELVDRPVRHRILDVERAFHTATTEPAAEALRQQLDRIAFADGATCWSAAHARPMSDPAGDLVDGVRLPVRFASAVRSIREQHRVFVELGPGSTLTGLVRRIDPTLTAIPLDPEPGDGGRGTVAAAAALLALGHAGLADILPGTRVQRALPAPPPAPPRRPQREGHIPVELVASTPAAAPEVAPRPVLDDDPVRSAVIAAVCEVTGYPAEFVDGDAELEGELGVDSIRKLEILGQLEDELGFRAAESDYALLERADVDTLTRFVRERAGAGGAVAPTEAARPGLWMPSGEVHTPVLAGLDVGDTWRVGTFGDAAPVEVVRALQGALAASDPHGFEVRGAGTPADRAALAWCRSVALERDLPIDAAPSPWIALAPEAALPEAPRLWVTGGLAGITHPILAAIADTSPRVAVFGRADLDAGGDRARAHREALHDLRDRGIEIRWVRCDLADRDQTLRIARRELADHGAPDLVLHAAGALADGLAHTLGEAELIRVFGAKLGGLQALSEAVDTRWLLFSSIAAERGNAGQSLYAAANAALHAWPLERATSVALTAWTERGMAADLVSVLERRGLIPVSPTVGSALFRELIAARLADDLPRHTALLGSPPEDRALAWPLTAVVRLGPDRAEARMDLDPDDPAVADHRVAGRPLVPAACWLQAGLSLLELVDPDTEWTLADLRIDAPTFVSDARRDLRVRLERSANHLEIAFVAGGTEVGHARAHPADGLAPAEPPQRLDDHPAARWYGEHLFHGPRWQVLDQVALSEDGATADFLLGRHPVASAVDGVHQLLALWSGDRTGWLTLPTGGTWTVARPNGATWARIELCGAPTEDGAVAQVRVIDPSGRVLAVARDVKGLRAGRWPDA